MLVRGLCVFVVSLTLCVSSGCSKATWSGALQEMAAGASQQSAPATLLVFGGEDHKTFLGCLNCSETSQSSILNPYSYGSPYGQTIFNHYSDYGSQYSNEGACSRYAQDPPVIVDSNGNYYGRLTVNQYHAQIGIGRNYIEWLQTKVCNS